MDFLQYQIFGIAVVEWFGYAASVVVAISLTMSSIVRLRWCNLVGAAMFSSYGFIIRAWPVGFLNLFITLIDIYYLVRMYREKDDFRIMSLGTSDEYLAYYLDSHRDEIARLFPRFDFAAVGRKAFWLVKNGTPIGVLIGKDSGAGRFVVELDFVGPAYRDLKMGRAAYREGGFFTQQGYSSVASPASGGSHDQYLEKIGFVREGDTYTKNV